MIRLEIDSEEKMLELGARLAALLAGEGVVHLCGDLGAGKTTLCRGILRAMGHSGAVKSPTFTLVEPYQFEACEVFHFDLYRLSDPAELDYVGIEEYFGKNRLCLVEWPEKAMGSLPHHDLEIGIDVLGEKRNIGIRANSPGGERICDQLIRQENI